MLGSVLVVGLGEVIVIGSEVVNLNGFVGFCLGALVLLFMSGATLSCLISGRDAPEKLIPRTA